PGRIEIVAPEENPKPEFLAFAQASRVVGIDVVAAVPAGVLKWSVRVRPFISQVRVRFPYVPTVGAESAARVAIPRLKAARERVRKGLALMNGDYAQTAETAILGAERAVINRDFANQLRAEGLERSQISLTVSLRALVLLDIVDQHFETAIHTAMVQVEAE